MRRLSKTQARIFPVLDRREIPLTGLAITLSFIDVDNRNISEFMGLGLLVLHELKYISEVGQ